MDNLVNVKQIVAATGIKKQAVTKRLKGITPANLEPHPGHPIRWYNSDDLPADYQSTLKNKMRDAELEAAVFPVAAAPALPAVQVQRDELCKAQRDCATARGRIADFVRDYDGSVEKAIGLLNEKYAAGRLSNALRWAFEHAWDKPRKKLKLNKKTYYNWLAYKAKRGSYAPHKVQPDMSIKPWHALAVELSNRPQGSSKRWIYNELVKQLGDQSPTSYDVLCVFFREKFSQLDPLKGRWSGSALRSHKFYQKRTSEGLLPAEEVHADGWNTHFTAPHPVTGEFVTYEVWHFHDAATRYVTPYGLGLTEKFEVIAKGLENYIRVFGVPLIVMTDSTKIVRGSARFTKDPVRSIEERVGCTITHPKEVGNSQANGICENYNTSWLDKCSRELATYQSPDQMDELTYKRVKKITAEMVKAANKGDLIERDKKKREAERMGKGRVFGSHAEAVEWLNATQTRYNNRPHRSLPKVRGEDGKLRHQTPAEALAEHIANGWEPALMGETRENHEAWLVDVFHPRTLVKVYREAVTPYGGMRYRNPDVLGHWNGKEVVVVYDVHDWQSVRVEERDGTLICVAQFAADTPYRAKTAYEDAEDKRARAQIRHKEKGIEKIRARNPGAVVEIEHVQTITDFLDLF
ncbi:MAG: Mu transposase C-terminal domain-containing protein [Nitrosomonadales bacterium]|nr:Mu transposase C-terminal domain-containing protein [Nitrosomonadales bacterium]